MWNGGGEIGGVAEEGEGISGVGTCKLSCWYKAHREFFIRHKRFSPVLVQFSTREGHFGDVDPKETELSCDPESQDKLFKIRTLELQFPYLKRKHWVLHFYQVYKTISHDRFGLICCRLQTW